MKTKSSLIIFCVCLFVVGTEVTNGQVLFQYDVPGNLTAQSNISTVPLPQFQQLNPGFVGVGSNATMSVSAPVTGVGPFSYQWYFNGNPITGATNDSYQVPSAGTTNLGSYQLVVRNSSGSS